MKLAMLFDPYAYACSDRMCGALDCPSCHPENFVDGEEFVEEEGEGEETPSGLSFGTNKKE